MQTADAHRCNLSMARCNDSSVTTTSQPNLIPFVFVLWVMSIDIRLINVVNYKQHATVRLHCPIIQASIPI